MSVIVGSQPRASPEPSTEPLSTTITSEEQLPTSFGNEARHRSTSSRVFQLTTRMETTRSVTLRSVFGGPGSPVLVARRTVGARCPPAPEVQPGRRHDGRYATRRVRARVLGPHIRVPGRRHTPRDGQGRNA